MLLRTSQLVNVPVMSLQTGKEIAQTSRVMLDPADLRIVAFELSGENLDQEPSFLRIQDVRELSDIGFIVDSSDEFVGLEDVIRLQEIYELHFDLENMKVIDTTKQKLGKVEGSIFDTNTFSVEQLRVRRPLFKSFGDAELLIHSKQIVEINNDEIVVKAPTVQKGEQAKSSTVKPEFKNPFRAPAPQPDTIDSRR